jgi:hypothetical protein
MRKSCVILRMSLALGALSVPISSAGDELMIVPSKIAVLPMDGDHARAAVEFDLSGVLDGEGRRLEEAAYIWEVEAEPGEAVEFEAWRLISAWTPEGVALGALPTTAEEPEVFWDIAPPSGECASCKVVKLDLKSLAADWLSNEESNHGILVRTAGYSTQELEAQLESAMLIVRYGFLPQ